MESSILNKRMRERVKILGLEGRRRVRIRSDLGSEGGGELGLGFEFWNLRSKF